MSEMGVTVREHIRGWTSLRGSWTERTDITHRSAENKEKRKDEQDAGTGVSFQTMRYKNGVNLFCHRSLKFLHLQQQNRGFK